MAIIIKKQTNLTIRRGLDYPLTFLLTGDFSAYTAIAECREAANPTSTLICNLGASVGTYDSQNNQTPVSILVARAVTATITQSRGYWSLVLITDDDVAEAYVAGLISFIDDPTGAISDPVVEP